MSWNPIGSIFSNVLFRRNSTNFWATTLSLVCQVIEIYHKLMRIIFSDTDSPNYILGGSLPDFFCQVASQLNLDWNRVKFIFCDERMLTEDDPESTFGVYKTKLIGKVSPDVLIQLSFLFKYYHGTLFQVAGIEESNFLTVNTRCKCFDFAPSFLCLF